MSLAQTVLKAVKKLGLATYTALENETGEVRNKLRWSCNELKARQLLKQAEDPTSNEVAWKLTTQGESHLEGMLIKAIAPEPKKAKTAPKQPAKAKPAKAKQEHVGRACATPAEGWANIIRSPESANPVGESATSTEVRAVVETQAADRSAEESALASADRPAVSDVKDTDHPYRIDLIQENSFTVKVGDVCLHGMTEVSKWEGFYKLCSHTGSYLIVARKPEPFRKMFGIFGGASTENKQEAVVISGSPELIEMLFPNTDTMRI